MEACGSSRSAKFIRIDFIKDETPCACIGFESYAEETICLSIGN